ncbi:MAG TPA: hypothetical protein VHB79_23340 [Polyangiaceae bacterium]|nr:hypothetical protein [Polyangiaceae bacterium]
MLAVVLPACNIPSHDAPPSAASVAAASAAAPAVVPSTPAPTVAASAAPPPSASAAIASVVGADYDASALRPIAEDCKAPLVVLTAVPMKLFRSEGYQWRFASQVAIANHGFKYRKSLDGGPGEIAFASVEHTATQGAALVARCTDTKTCTRFAAAYKTVVPSSKPELFCAKAPTLGADLQGGPSVQFGADADIFTVAPGEADTVSECVRLAACQAERDKKLDGDPAIECQKHPSHFKVGCATQKTCADVLSCAAGHH